MQLNITLELAFASAHMSMEKITKQRQISADGQRLRNFTGACSSPSAPRRAPMLPSVCLTDSVGHSTHSSIWRYSGCLSVCACVWKTLVRYVRCVDSCWASLI